MKASHNSATGEKPLNLWARLFPFIANCQDKTIKEQYEAGVRLFDIRVRYDDKEWLRCCHGLATYDKTLWEVCADLYKKSDVWIMVTYEGVLPEEDEDRFIFSATSVINEHRLHVGHISVKLPEWNIIAPATQQPACAQNYSKIVGWKILLPFPRLWNWLLKKSQEQDEEGMIDFV